MVKNDLSSYRNIPFLLGVLSLLLLSYSVFRAFHIPFTIDEISSLKDFANDSMANILYAGPVSANNHILNSLGMKLSGALFGDYPFVYRIPNLLAHVVFLLSSIRITLRLKDPLLIICGFLVLNLHPYVLDFFSLARGYGLAAGFFLASMNAFILFSETRNNKHILFSFLLMGLAVWSNFSLLIFFLALWPAWLLVILSDMKGSVLSKENFILLFKKALIPFSCSLLLLAIIYVPVWKLNNFGALYYGGATGFWSDTFNSLLIRLLYFNDGISFIKYTVLICIVLLLIVWSSYGLSSLFKSGRKAITPFALLFFVMSIAAAVTFFQHLILGSKFMLDRTALCFIPAFMLTLILFCGEIFSKGRIQLARGILFAFGIAVSLNFFAAFNLSYCYEWRFDASVEEMLNDLEKEKKGDWDSSQKITLATSWPMVFSANYYKNRMHLAWIDTIVTDRDSIRYDYYYVHPEFSKPDTTHLSLKYRYKNSGASLYAVHRALP